MGCRAQRPINTNCLRDVPAIKRIMASLSREVRTCAECAEEVTINESEHLPNPGAGIPFAKATILGCDAAIDKVIEGILSEGARQGIDLNDCFESKKL
jgi:hypothetical protein